MFLFEWFTLCQNCTFKKYFQMAAFQNLSFQYPCKRWVMCNCWKMISCDGICVQNINLQISHSKAYRGPYKMSVIEFFSEDGDRLKVFNIFTINLHHRCHQYAKILLWITFILQEWIVLCYFFRSTYDIHYLLKITGFAYIFWPIFYNTRVAVGTLSYYRSRTWGLLY